MKYHVVLAPRDGLTVKDARGFNVAGGDHARGHHWPPPSTLAGAARTAVGLANGFSTTPNASGKKKWRRLLDTVTIRALPLVRDLGTEFGGWTALWPCPSDMLGMAPKRVGRPLRVDHLRPVAAREDGCARGSWATGDATDATAEDRALEGLWYAQPSTREKPRETPPFITDRDMLLWLGAPESLKELKDGVGAVPRFDMRVSIDSKRATAKQSHLFGLETYELLLPGRKANARLARSTRELAIGMEVTIADEALNAEPRRVWRLGGESRLAIADCVDDKFIRCPERALEPLIDQKQFRVICVSAAHFRTGWRPDWLEPVESAEGWVYQGVMPALGRRVVLRAALVSRSIPMSGWDMAKRGPKPSRRLVPPGSVYHFELQDNCGLTKEELSKLWLGQLGATTQQDSRDGYGLFIPGVSSVRDQATCETNVLKGDQR